MKKAFVNSILNFWKAVDDYYTLAGEKIPFQNQQLVFDENFSALALQEINKFKVISL